jgi:glyoxylase-like metal-dependent hydrolase (beta-lactamase superfamily II)
VRVVAQAPPDATECDAALGSALVVPSSLALVVEAIPGETGPPALPGRRAGRRRAVTDLGLAVASPWFGVEDVGEGVTKVTEPHLSGLVSANLWWIRGRRHDVLVDTGLGVASLRQHLPEVVDHDTLAVISHTHLDHTGGAHELERVAVHELEADAMAMPPPASLHPRTELELLGLALPDDADLPSSLLEALPEPGYDPSAYAVRPATVTRTLVDGDVIDLGDRRLRIIHLPGHTAGSIVVLDEDLRWLYTGDVMYDGPLFDEMYGADIRSYVASMRRLLDLDVAVVHPGHDESFGPDRLHGIGEEYLHRRAGYGVPDA